MLTTPLKIQEFQRKLYYKAKQEKKTDPHGRLLDCPDCGAPLDHDTDFGAPYCWDCDKYF